MFVLAGKLNFYALYNSGITQFLLELTAGLTISNLEPTFKGMKLRGRRLGLVFKSALKDRATELALKFKDGRLEIITTKSDLTVCAEIPAQPLLEIPQVISTEKSPQWCMSKENISAMLRNEIWTTKLIFKNEVGTRNLFIKFQENDISASCCFKNVFLEQQTDPVGVAYRVQFLKILEQIPASHFDFILDGDFLNIKNKDQGVLFNFVVGNILLDDEN